MGARRGSTEDKHRAHPRGDGRRPGRWWRWGFRLGVVGCLLTLLVWAANVPFYSGWSTPSFGRRMEHGRLRLAWDLDAGGARESFYIAPNSEGLRFRPDWRFWGARSGYVNVPLWMLLIGEGAVAAWCWRRARRAHHNAACANCGYALEGLPPGQACPECGQRTGGAA